MIRHCRHRPARYLRVRTSWYITFFTTAAEPAAAAMYLHVAYDVFHLLKERATNQFTPEGIR